LDKENVVKSLLYIRVYTSLGGNRKEMHGNTVMYAALQVLIYKT